MKTPILMIVSVIVLSKISSISNTAESTKTNFKLYEAELPAKIKHWKSKEYGLEITGDITRGELDGDDLDTQNKVAEYAKRMMKNDVNNLLSKKNGAEDSPQLKIAKMDAISYEFNEQKMLITFTEIELRNLDTYDEGSAKYSQLGTFLTGEYEMKDTMYNAILANKLEKKAFVDRTYIEEAHEDEDGETIPKKYFLKRKDVEWNINISAKFVSNQKWDEDTEKQKKQKQDTGEQEKPKASQKPIIINTKFKIQPDLANNQQSESDDKKPLRAKGVAKIEFYDFNFDITFVVTHIDDPLRKYFPKEKRSENLVPHFEVDYKVENIEIPEDGIKLFEYDKDDEFPENNEENSSEKKIEDVNDFVDDDLPKVTEKSSKKNSRKIIIPKAEAPPILKENYDEVKKQVVEHFEVLKKQVKDNRETFKKKMYLNLLPKMAWKIMQMTTKRQLPQLLRELITYDDEFREKTRLSEITLTDNIFQGMQLASGYAKEAVVGLKDAAVKRLSAPMNYLRRIRSA